MVKKFMAVVLAIVLCLNISTVAFAGDIADESPESIRIDETTDNARKVRPGTWCRFFWKILADYLEKACSVDPISEDNENWTYLVTSDVEYNTGDMGNEIYFQPEVDDTVGTIRMHGHRIIFVDIFAQLALILSDASGYTVSNATTGTNQYMFYTRQDRDDLGSWKAQFISTETYKWQLYYAQYYNANKRAATPEVEDGFYFANNNRVFQFSDATAYTVAESAPEIVDMTALNNQFINPADGKTVDYLKDYSAGDTVKFSDAIVNISYDSEENATTLYFLEDVSGNEIGWKFNGNLTSMYDIGDIVNLSFDVLNVAEYNDITFESLDYFEAAYAHEMGTPYPDISDYQ